MPSRLAGKALTSPIAFLVAGLLDLTAIALSASGRRIASALRRLD